MFNVRGIPQLISMVCPFCLGKVRFQVEKQADNARQYVCPAADCGQPVPRIYVEEYTTYPPIVGSVIGHRAHGKTVFLSTLYYVLTHLDLSRFWEQFYYFPINQQSLDVVFDNANMLEEGRLPSPSQKVFPEPTMMQVSHVPLVNRATLLFYDTAGEAFLNVSEIRRYAGFVKRAGTVLFMVSLPRIREQNKDVSAEMERLLHTYIQGMKEMGASSEKQHLVVVFTCADLLFGELETWPDIAHYVQHDSQPNLSDPMAYLAGMYQISARLRMFVRSHLQAQRFLNLVDERFNSVQFSITSALGAAPDEEGNLMIRIRPRRVLDPFIWILEKSISGWKRWSLERRVKQVGSRRQLIQGPTP